MKNERGESNRSRVCIDPRAGGKLYDYYNEMLAQQEAQSFEEHLLLCFQCQDEIFTLDLILYTLKKERLLQRN